MKNNTNFSITTPTVFSVTFIDPKNARHLDSLTFERPPLRCNDFFGANQDSWRGSGISSWILAIQSGYENIRNRKLYSVLKYY